jgi:hypothetical protein
MFKLTLLFVISVLSMSLSASAQQVPPFEVIQENAPFPGYLFRPKTDKPSPAIMMLHGSEGGNGDFWKYPGLSQANTGINSFTVRLAKYFASQGFVTYALCYFQCEKFQGFENYPPEELVGVDLQNVTYKAYLWLKDSKFVGEKKVALWGGSRGAEQVLLLSSLVAKNKGSIPSHKPIDFVIADAPSDFVAGGFSKLDAKLMGLGLPPSPLNKNAWTFLGAPVKTGVPIEVEYDTAPTLIIYGAKDEIWGPTVKPYNLVERYSKALVPHKFYSFNNLQNAEAALKDLEPSLKGKVIVRLEDEGHMPRPGTPSEKLTRNLIYKFLQVQFAP